MQIPVDAKSKSLQGINDLTLIAPVKSGLIDGLDTRSYATRLRLLFATLQAGRVNQREIVPARMFSDAVDRIREILSFRLALFDAETEPRVLLAVTFSSPWEPYLRKVWEPLGPLLDLILCNCEGYVTAWNHDFPVYAEWVRSVQLKTEFFYSAGPTTADDLIYLRQVEALVREREPTAARELDLAKVTVPDPQRPVAARIADPLLQPEYLEQGLKGMLGLHALADMYRPGTPDGDILQRAARELLKEWPPGPELQLDPRFDLLYQGMRERYDRAFAWFEAPLPRRPPPPPASEAHRASAQGGILRPYADTTHGCVALVAFDGPAAAGTWLQHIVPRISAASVQSAAGDAGTLNLAFSFEGLRQLGLEPQELAALPGAFREGMAARCGVLGDYRVNHPRHWRLPRSFDGRGDPVQPSSVHALLILRLSDREAAPAERHRLHAALARRLDDLTGHPGVHLLAVEPTWRNALADGSGLSREHFGFADGISQPRAQSGAAAHARTPAARAFPGPRDGRTPTNAGWHDEVPIGDLLIGHPNGMDDRPMLGGLWTDGSFLVVRKLRQRVGALDGCLSDPRLAQQGLSREQALAALMGRDPDGVSTLQRPARRANAGRDNRFTYEQDPLGLQCPIHAHVRRMNPRPPLPDAYDPARDPSVPTRVPRVIRRGMSYGPPYRDAIGNADTQDTQDRGLFFMAYNASLEEQFEALQHWLAGGNSSGGHSTQCDPFLGVLEPGAKRVFRFADARGRVRRIDLSTRPDRPLVELQWGGYFLAPSLAALRAWTQRARQALPDAQPPRALWSAAAGQRRIERLQAAERAGRLPEPRMAWKTLLEDLSARMSGASADTWAAIRERHGGALRTPYGVVVADRDLVMEVLRNDRRRYSVSGYRHRMQASFGDIYLGFDDGPDYRRIADPVNQAIAGISTEQAFERAYVAAASVIGQEVLAAQQAAQIVQQTLGADAAGTHWEATIEVRELSDRSLMALCEHWFGVPDGVALVAAGFDGRRNAPAGCPGHFGAPSRYIFQPWPGDTVREFGQAHGQALRPAMKQRVDGWRPPGAAAAGVPGAAGPPPGASISQAVLAACPDNDLAARTLIGVLMGFLPTTDGVLRSTLYEWALDRSLWDRLLEWRRDDAQGPAGPESSRQPYARAERLIWPHLLRTMQWRPVPELIWRTATEPHRLGQAEVQVGDRVVLALVSAMQLDLETGHADASPIFGGDRLEPGAPQHACPGSAIARGVLLGILAALLDAGDLQPGPSPLALQLRGPCRM